MVCGLLTSVFCCNERVAKQGSASECSGVLHPCICIKRTPAIQQCDQRHERVLVHRLCLLDGADCRAGLEGCKAGSVGSYAFKAGEVHLLHIAC